MNFSRLSNVTVAVGKNESITQSFQNYQIRHALELLEEQMKPEATKRIQNSLVLEAVAKAENIEISDERLDEELARMAESYRMEPDKLKEMMSDEEKEQMKSDLAVQEAVNLVRDAAVEIEKAAGEKEEA